MYTLVLNGNSNSSPSSTRYLDAPVTIGSRNNDSFSLTKDTTGFFDGGPKNDEFTYETLGSLNTYINGGSGEDTIAFRGLSAGQALKALFDNKYSFVKRPNGFSLRIPGNQANQGEQEIKVDNVEKVAFTDRTFDLRNTKDLNDFVKALQDNKITIVDESKMSNGQQGWSSNSGNSNMLRLIPVGNSYPNSQSGRQYSNGLFNNVWPQGYSGGYQQPSSSGFNSLLQPFLGGSNSYGYNNGYPMSSGSYSMGYPQGSGLLPLSSFQSSSLGGNWGGLSGASANGNFDFRNSSNIFNVFNGPVYMGSEGQSYLPNQFNQFNGQFTNSINNFYPDWTSASSWNGLTSSNSWGNSNIRIILV